MLSPTGKNITKKLKIRSEFSDSNLIKDRFSELLKKVINSSEDLADWVISRSDFEDQLNELQAVLYIRMTSQTDNEKYAADYKHFVSECQPLIREYTDKLDVFYISNVKSVESFSKEQKLYYKRLKNRIDLFKDENVVIETDIALLSQEYQSIAASLSVQFKGEELTLQMMQPFLQSSDRDERRDAWEMIANKKIEQKEIIGQLFEKMLIKRDKLAKNAGFSNFRDYQFRKFERFDYSPDDCERFHNDVKRHIVPLLKNIHEKKRAELEIEDLYPWDLNGIPKSDKLLAPFKSTEEFLDKTGQVFMALDNDFYSYYQDMCNNDLLDLESRLGKAPGGYQIALSEMKKPFVFMNSVGIDQDMRTLFHEAGHAFHTYLTREIAVNEFRSPPIEFCEVASMSMELFCSEYLNKFYDCNDCRRSFQRQLEDIVKLLPWIAQVDAFQHWIYMNNDASVDERNTHWLKLCKDFGTGMVNWQGNESYQKISWHGQLHIFEYPFYYIEYGIAQLGALSFWEKFLQNKSATLQNYKKSLSKGGRIGLRDLFSSAGLPFSLDDGVVKKAAEFLKNIIEKK